jgi:hypothetical protein
LVVNGGFYFSFLSSLKKIPKKKWAYFSKMDIYKMSKMGYLNLKIKGFLEGYHYAAKHG